MMIFRYLIIFVCVYEVKVEVESDTWTAVDNLGRILPNLTDVGPLKANRTVALFYFLTLGNDGVSDGPYDVSKILKDHPEALYNLTDSHWGPLYSSHHWGESLFGYYLIDDDFILRKHASMIVNAGVDLIVFDVSNAVTYRDSYRKLCSIYMEIRNNGGRTPQIAFLCPFGNPDDIGRRTARALFDDLYSQGLYSDLWFRWKGKPLMLADPDYVDDDLREFFTLRRPIAPYNQGPTGYNQWAWLEIYPQHIYKNSDGENEEVAVGVAQNYNTIQYNSTAPMSWPGAFGRSYHNNSMDNRTIDAVNWGFNFAEQWKRALELDPLIVFVTGWNEWTAGKYDSWSKWTSPPVIFVDEFTQEFSRDIEPMMGGHGDNYYYQLVSFIRQYKGVRPLSSIKANQIKIDGDFSDWISVLPSFDSDPSTPVQRNFSGYGKSGQYVNTTGRNDIVQSKVSFDDENIYFYVRTRNLTTNSTDKNWMLLFLNTDVNYTTGWLGYDYLVNLQVESINRTSISKNKQNNIYDWIRIDSIDFALNGTQLELSIPRKLIHFEKFPLMIDFKWSDNIQQDGSSTDFTLNGDSAPPDRFNFRAIFN